MTGNRFKEERERLGWNQDRVAAVAGCTRRTVVDWEAEKSSPRADQLSLLVDAGFDGYYVLTGQRVGSVTMLSVRESALVENYRAAPERQTGSGKDEHLSCAIARRAKKGWVSILVALSETNGATALATACNSYFAAV